MAKINYDEVKKVNKSVSNRKTNEFDLIVAIVNRGFSDYVVDAATNAGASGATIIMGRGTGIHENDVILGIKIQPEKEIVLILVNKTKRKEIMKTIVEAASLDVEGKGLCFSLPVNDIAGIKQLMKKNK